jgi:hypothetical protein
MHGRGPEMILLFEEAPSRQAWMLARRRAGGIFDWGSSPSGRSRSTLRRPKPHEIEAISVNELSATLAAFP